ncbi:MAG: hypothetical protein WCA81_09465 [Rhizomicrobium sp.]
MSDELSTQLLALYRAGAQDEPHPDLDMAILGAARRHDRLVQATRVFVLVASCVLLAAWFQIESRPQHEALPMHIATASRPGLEDGRARLFLLTLKSDTQRPGMAQHPAMLND